MLRRYLLFIFIVGFLLLWGKLLAIGLPRPQQTEQCPPLILPVPEKPYYKTPKKPIPNHLQKFNLNYEAYSPPLGHFQVQPSVLPIPRANMSPKRLSLLEAIMLALRNNPNVISAEMQRVIDKFTLEVAHNEFEPQFTLTGDGTFTKGVKPVWNTNFTARVKSTIGTEYSVNYRNPLDGSDGIATFDIKQPLLRGFGYVNRIPYDDALDNELIARLDFKDKIIQVVDVVIAAYRALVGDINNLRIQKRTLAENQEQVRRYRLEVKAGKMAPADLQTELVSFANTKLSYVQTKNTYQQDYQSFLSVLGLVPDANLTIEPNIQFVHYKIPSEQKAIALALKGNIAYRQSVIALRNAQRAVISAEDARKWKLDLDASAQAGNTLDSNGNKVTADVNPTLVMSFEVPIDQIQTKADLVSAKISLENEKRFLLQQKEDLVREVITLIETLHNDLEQIDIQEAQVKAQQISLNAARLKQQYGKGVAYIVTQQQDQLLSQQLNVVNDKIAFLNDYTRLNDILGITLDKWHIHLRY